MGDCFKLGFLFGSSGNVTTSFKMCGLFQAACDAFLGVQYWMFGSREPVVVIGSKSTQSNGGMEMQ